MVKLSSLAETATEGPPEFSAKLLVQDVGKAQWSKLGPAREPALAEGSHEGSGLFLSSAVLSLSSWHIHLTTETPLTDTQVQRWNKPFILSTLTR